jgi:UDP-2-acetamido-3-amino-2,3-dideoxy-glucuronate N-acetyltransferase
VSTDYFIHESAFVDEGAIIGVGTKIWHFCHVMGGAEIGGNCVLGQNVFVGGRAKIGNNVRIQNNVSVYDMVTIEDNVFCGPSMVFTNVINPRAEIRRNIDEYRPTLVKEGATIGANATVVCGHVIGRYAFVGAGAVVTKDVPDYALVYGNATRIAGWICECGEKLNFGNHNPHEGDGIAECANCGKRYEKHGLTVEKRDRPKKYTEDFAEIRIQSVAK